MTVICNYPEDIGILESKLIEVLTDIAVEKCTTQEIDAMIEYLEKNECIYFE